MKNRLLFSLCLPTALGLAAVLVFLWLTPPKHRINRQSFELIQVGMSEQEVEAILLVPAGNYLSQETEQRLLLSSQFRGAVLGAKGWSGDLYGSCEDIWITFDEAGNVVDKQYAAQLVLDTSFVTRIMRWLQLH